MPRATSCLAGAALPSAAVTPLTHALNEDDALSSVVEAAVDEDVVVEVSGSPHVYRGANVSVTALAVGTMTGLDGSDDIAKVSGPIWMVAAVIAVLERLMMTDWSEKAVKGAVVPAFQSTDNTAGSHT
jgi:hypothetical protein